MHASRGKQLCPPMWRSPEIRVDTVPGHLECEETGSGDWKRHTEKTMVN
ncbi:MAG TPA: hypothetical protein PLO57_02795 [Candidatus Cloacimonadota bacterium]|nr:hypothetical protein [Candidatus Cloacimonadota bacterium]